MHRLGIDIGGTDIKIGVIDEQNHVIDFGKIPTLAQRPWEEIIRDIIAAVSPFIEQYAPLSIGIGSPGRVNPKEGMVIRAGNLSFRNVPMARLFEEAFHLPVALENDANCALIAEMKAGVCQGFTEALILTLGTGVGGAMVLNNQLYSGYNFRAGEFGHFVVQLHGHPCKCGLEGCFEQYASASALIRDTKAAILEAPGSLLASLGTQGVDGRTPFLAAQQGCPVGEKVVAEYAYRLAAGLNSLQFIFQPQCIALSGGIAKQGDYLIERIFPHLLPEVNVRVSSFSGHGGLIGAALLPTL
ncbi:MAG: ROK family protein [Clostridiales bacterium]|nr:ROK family protein [Clostridiales bacterium]